MIQFSLFGIPISIQPFFWITMALIGGANTAGTSRGLLFLALFVIAGFISILVHELGHALTIKAFKLRPSITLQAFGGYASYPAGILTRPQSFLVTAAGPGIQLVLAAAAYFLLEVPNIKANPNTLYFFYVLFIISTFWALLNLLPILPLDGGQLLNAALGPSRIKITLWVTIITAIVAGLLMIRFTGSFLFPIFLGFFAFQAFQALKENNWR